MRGNPCAARVAYVYNTDTTSRDSFEALLTSRGLGVDLVTLAAAETFDFSNDQAIIIGNDTGNQWMSGALPAAVSHVNAAGKPIIGVGEGGYAFFGRLALAIGFAMAGMARAPAPTALWMAAQAIYAAPYPIAVSTGATLALYERADQHRRDQCRAGRSAGRRQPDRALAYRRAALRPDLAARREERMLRAVGIRAARPR